MEPHQPQKCKWEGYCANDVVFGGTYCQEHKKQYHQTRPPQPDKNQAFPSLSANPPPNPPKDSATTRLGNRVNENGLLNGLYSSGISLSTNEKKQLPEKHVARKSTKQPSNIGQTHTSPTPHAQRPSTDTPSTNPRPVKRQRVSGMSNLSDLHPRSNSSSFSENGIPPSSKRDDFALRPKKKEAANESARSKLYNDQRQSYRGESHPGSSSRQTSTSTKPPPSTGLNGIVRSASFVIDLTRDDPEPPFPRPKPQISPKGLILNGSAVVGHQKPNRPSDVNPDLPREQRNVVTLNNKQGQESPNQPGGVSQGEHAPTVEQVSRNLHAQKSPQTTVPSAPTVQVTLKPTKETSSKSPNNKQRPNVPTLENGLGPVHMVSSGTPTHPYNVPPIEKSPLANGIRQVSLNEKISVPIDSGLGRSETEEIAIKKTIEPSAQATPIPKAPMTPRIQATVVATPHQSDGIQPPAKNVQPAPVPLTEKGQSPMIITEGPLSALLGGREWKKMSPEERRLFWVSQHDPEILDAQIYSENNRPFRPGDVLFGLADDALPPRPTRIATHFDYLDLRPRFSNQRFEEWYRQKQNEISARGNRKTDLGEVFKRAVQRKRATPTPNQKQKRDSLPQRVRDNPKWLAALDVLEKFEAQARSKGTSKTPRENTAKEKAPATVDATLDSDADMESV